MQKEQAMQSADTTQPGDSPQQPAPAAPADPRAALDAERARCPVAPGDAGGWSVYAHAEVRRIVTDHETFSNAVSRHLSIPNGMDPPAHTPWRRALEPCFSRERVAAFEPECRRIAARLAARIADGANVDCMDAFAGAFAGAVQCAFLGWPQALGDTLRAWVGRNQAAIRAGDRERLAELAAELEALLEPLLAARRSGGGGAPADLTAALLQERVEGRAVRTAEVVSILRNWTVGEVGTIAAAVGILAHHLAADPALQRQLRADEGRLAYAIDEILRLDGPLAANRRRTTCPVRLGGHDLAAGESLTLHWIAANRDPAVFEAPAAFRWDRDPGDNLLYGAGIHVCPGAPLARMELRVALQALLRATRWIEPAPADVAVRAQPPAAGFERLPLRCLPAD